MTGILFFNFDTNKTWDGLIKTGLLYNGYIMLFNGY